MELLLVMMALLNAAACGPKIDVIVEGGAEAYTFATAQADCGGCHGAGGVAPRAFMASEAAFRASGALAQVQAGLMPKGSPYTVEKATAFEAWFKQ